MQHCVAMEKIIYDHDCRSFTDSFEKKIHRGGEIVILTWCDSSNTNVLFLLFL